MGNKKAVKTIIFEDHGQDFLEWDIDAEGIVVETRPPLEFQTRVWVNRKVVNPDVKRGDLVIIVLDELAYLEDVDRETPIKFPVLSVSNICRQCDGMGSIPAPDGYAICRKCMGRGKY